jgi:hypothetical protein
MYDVFFLAWDETQSETNWENLLEICPAVRRVTGIKGIYPAHARCAELSRTSHFFVVDADNEIIDPTPFEITIPEWDQEYVHLWHARNPVNGLEYGWGGLKLFPRASFPFVANMDMTTTLPLKIIERTVSVSHFNSSPFETWRAAFREAVKLSLQGSQEAQERLSVWCGVAEGPMASWCLLGAQEGRQYAKENQDTNALVLINDYEWLKTRFQAAAGLSGGSPSASTVSN